MWPTRTWWALKGCMCVCMHENVVGSNKNCVGSKRCENVVGSKWCETVVGSNKNVVGYVCIYTYRF